MKTGLNMVSRLAAIALFGVLAARAGFAEESGGAGHGNAAEAKPSAMPGPAGSAPPAPAADKPAAAGGAKDSEPIDTRISVQPRRPPGARDSITAVKPLKTVAPRNLLARPPASRGPSEPGRNAVGISIFHVEGPEQRNAVHGAVPGLSPPVVSPLVRSPAPGTVGAFGATPRKPQAYLIRPASPAVGTTTVVRPVAIRPGAINGSAVTPPHGGGASGIGGPAKAATGINGTTFRPKP
jgi:hypothetical protein